MADFAHPAPTPAPFTYTSADDAYSVYGWSVTMHRTAREFSTLENASKSGFALAGSGSANVVTPAGYKRRARYRVMLSGDKVSSHRVASQRGATGGCGIDVLARALEPVSGGHSAGPGRRHRGVHDDRPDRGDGAMSAERATPRPGLPRPDRSAERADRRCDRTGRRHGRPPNLFSTLARHRRLFRAWLRFAGALMPRGSLPRADTELVILRVAHNSRCEYEWRHHERLGPRPG